MRQEIIREIEEKLGYHFHNPGLLKQAFTRSSYVNERVAGRHPADTQSNEVLEFFGDSVLSAALAYLLLKQYAEVGDAGLKTTLGEADFSIIKSNMSDKRALAAAVRRLGVGRYMRLSRGDENQNILEQDSPNEDLFESIIAAVALDCNMDFETVVRVVKRIDDVERLLARRGDGAASKNAKSAVKEWCEKRRVAYNYEVIGTEGPEHKKTYYVRLTVDGMTPVSGVGASKPKAEMNAAEKMLAQLV